MYYWKTPVPEFARGAHGAQLVSAVEDVPERVNGEGVARYLCVLCTPSRMVVKFPKRVGTGVNIVNTRTASRPRGTFRTPNSNSDSRVTCSQSAGYFTIRGKMGRENRINPIMDDDGKARGFLSTRRDSPEPNPAPRPSQFRGTAAAALKWEQLMEYIMRTFASTCIQAHGDVCFQRSQPSSKEKSCSGRVVHNEKENSEDNL